MSPRPLGAAGPCRFSVVPAVYVFLIRPADGTQEVLLQLRRNTGFRDGHWAAAVAGHVERGESLDEAARREAAEEAGLTDVDLEPWCAMQRTGRGQPIDERVDFFFLARSWSGEPRVAEPDKNAGLRWCRLDRLDDLPGPVVPHERRVLDSVRAGRAPAFLSDGF